MFKLYGADLSSPSNKVRYVANLLDLEYEYIRISIKDSENKKEEYLKIHPAGKIPAIDDDGFILFESDAICKYLASKTASDLYPANLKNRALVDQWVDFASIHINTAMGKVLFNRVFYRFAKIQQDERSLGDGLNFLGRYLPVVGTKLGKTKFISGDAMSLADITLLSALDPAEIGDFNIMEYKNIVKWRDELRKKDFYTACHKKYGEKLEKIVEKRKE